MHFTAQADLCNTVRNELPTFLIIIIIQIQIHIQSVQIFDELQKRASGEIWTLAHWIRDFVDKHPSYKHDSEVPQDTIYDLTVKVRSF